MFRYRYDTETGLYYLQSRYYNPSWSRFINADGIIGIPGELLSCNMFAYCCNNPVNIQDQSGYLWGFVDELVAQFSNAINIFKPLYATAGGCALADGPFIFGDIIGGVLLGVATIGVIGYTTYSTVSASVSREKSQNLNEKSKKSGRAKNKLKPDANAEGDHTTFKRDPSTGEITNYETWKSNPKNPTGFDSEKRYDGIGKTHTNPKTKEDLMPHVHDRTVPGGVRKPLSWEVPGSL